MYLELISKKYQGNSKEVEARLYGGLARNYLLLGMNEKAVELWQNAINSIEGLSDAKFLNSVFRNNMSLALINLDETEKAKDNLIEALEIYPLTSTYKTLSKLVLDADEDFELSEFYLRSGLSLIDNDSIIGRKPYINDSYLKKLHQANIVEGYAYHYFVLNEYDTSIGKYLEVLSIAEDIKRVSLRVDILKKIGHLYQKIGDTEKSARFLTKYIHLEDSLRVIKNNSLSITMHNFISERSTKVEAEKNGNTGYYILFMVLTLVGCVFIITFYVKSKRAVVITNNLSDNPKSQDLALSLKTENSLLQKLDKFEASNEFLDKNMSMSRLIGLLETNVKYLRHLLKTYKNTDYNSYINELRINYILEKLKTDPVYLNYKISYLADECGFSSHSKFSANFKRVTKLSPSEFISSINQDTNKS